MKKSFKIAGGVLLLLIVALGGAALYVWHGVYVVPAFYERAPLEGQERLEALASVERKVLNFQSAIDAAYAKRAAQASAAERPSTRPKENLPETDLPTGQPISISFTGPELDTYFAKWLDDSGYAAGMSKYIRNPRVAVMDGYVVLAGRMPEFEAVVSLYFLPTVDEDGVAQLTLDSVYAGRIPMPTAAFDGLRDRAAAALSEDLPSLRRQAGISEQGIANDAAIAVTMQQQLLELLRGREVEPLIIFPMLLGRGRVPARVSTIEVDDHAVTFGVELLDASQRGELLERLREEADLPAPPAIE